MHDESRSNDFPVTGIILAGGRSHRMGKDKCWLPWGKQVLLQHIVETLRPGLDPLIVVAQRGQELPTLPKHILIGYDAERGQGPLFGLQTGLAVAPTDRPLFVTGCDYPFANLQTAQFLARALKEYDAVVPRWQGQAHPLVAVYQPTIRSVVESSLASGPRSMHALIEQLQVRWIEDEEWKAIDPGGRVLWNVNTPEEYQAALESFISSSDFA